MDDNAAPESSKNESTKNDSASNEATQSSGVKEGLEVAKDKIVLINYRLSNADGEVIDDTMDIDPIAVMYGRGNVLKGLEKSLHGHVTGDQYDVVVAPRDGYGERQEDHTQRISKKYFTNVKRLKPGMQTILRSEQGERRVTVLKVGGKVIDVDLNHPLAGQALHFSVRIADVREATSNELAHGHAHGPGGHHH